MNQTIRKCLVAGAISFSLVAPMLTSAAEDKVQKITFVEDDGQKYFASRIFELKHSKASDIVPFLREAALRYAGESHVSSVNDADNKRQLVIISTGVNNMENMAKLVAVLDRPSKINKYGSTIAGDGAKTGFYRPQFRAAESMKDIIVKGQVFNGVEDSLIMFDPGANLFYFKDAPSTVGDIYQKLEWFDKEIPQTRLEMTIYEVRDSDMHDVGIDYLAWKNGPGLNLFAAGYDALYLNVAETLINTLADKGVDLFGNLSYGFGGFYTAPAFDMSFVRMLQQNGKATISSTASILLTNNKDTKYTISFAPEYQNLVKDENHASSVAVGGANSITATVSNGVITSGPRGVVNFTIDLVNSSVVERNNLGAEITESTTASATASLNFNQEKLVTCWERFSEVEQTVGIPVLCELPILKYIFGTTTKNVEKTYYFVSVKAVPVKINDNVETGLMKEFDELCRK